jgi:Mg-chelatase subunit ChlD
LASTAPADCEPLVALLPAQPPEAVQAVVLTDFQVNVARPPLLTVLGVALKATVGAVEATVTVVDCEEALPPRPVQVST